MKSPILSFIVGVVTVVSGACSTAVPRAVAQSTEASGEHSAAPGTTGKVVETMDAGTYTYVQVDDGAKKIWAAAPQFSVKVGDTVVVPAGMPMRDFQSKTLGRTFDVVYFVQGIQVQGAQAPQTPPAAAHGAGEPDTAAHAAAGHGSPKAIAPAGIDFSNIKKADGGQTVAELYAQKQALVGKEVAVRGRVVKFTSAVMGKNWVHVQDGSGSAATNDLAATTTATAAVGNTVVVRGKLSADKDFGFGYRYDILIEDAALTVE